jgi:RNA polymerase sigma-70 factor (ECF subfamily)
MVTLSFSALVAEARRGDEDAVRELVRQYEPEIRRFARAHLGAPLRTWVGSMDVINSVYRSLFLGLRRARFDLAAPEQLVALAVTMVRRKIARHWRRWKRQQQALGRPHNLDALAERLPAPPGEDDPVGSAIVAEITRRLPEALSGTERKLVEGRLQGYSTAEIARDLGVNADVLRVQWGRLRQRLQAAGRLDDLLGPAAESPGTPRRGHPRDRGGG